jgi:hypothetical protein
MNRERLTILRDHLASLPDERVDMRWYVSGEGAGFPDAPVKLLDECGTAACIAGWAAYLFEVSPEGAFEPLSLTADQSSELFFPDDFSCGHLTRADAITAINSMLENPSDDARPIWPERA